MPEGQAEDRGYPAETGRLDRERPTAVAADEPVAPVARPAGVVAVLNRDLMFGMRIRNALGSLGLGAAFASDTEAFVDLVQRSEPVAVLGVIDANGAVDWESVARLVADPAVSTPLLAFGPHVDVEGRRAAKAAGVTRIVSNGDFHRDTIGLLRRYAFPATTAPEVGSSHRE